MPERPQGGRLRVPLLLAVAGLWAFLPGVVEANDCPSVGELAACLRQAFGPLASVGLIGAALGGLGLAMRGDGPPLPPPTPDPSQPPAPVPGTSQPQVNHPYPSYDPGGINMGGSGSGGAS